MMIPADIIPNKTEPQFQNYILKEWFNTSIDDCQEALKGQAIDRAFIMKRKNEDPKQPWTGFNEDISDINLEKTTVGYMPIIPSVAYKIDKKG